MTNGIPPKPPYPWWGDLIRSMIPDVRAWATVAIFGLAAYDLTLIATHPALSSNELFKTATILLLGTGGLGLACSFLWGGSKASAAAADTVNAVALGSAAPPSGSTTTTTHTVATESTDKPAGTIEDPVVIASGDKPVVVKEEPPA